MRLYIVIPSSKVKRTRGRRRVPKPPTRIRAIDWVSSHLLRSASSRVAHLSFWENVELVDLRDGVKITPQAARLETRGWNMQEGNESKMGCPWLWKWSRRWLKYQRILSKSRRLLRWSLSRVGPELLLKGTRSKSSRSKFTVSGALPFQVQGQATVPSFWQASPPEFWEIEAA